MKQSNERNLISRIIIRLKFKSDLRFKIRLRKYKEKEKSGLTVEVRNNDVSKALRILKKRMQNEGLFNEMRDRTFFQSRGEKRRLAKAAGRRRWLKKVEKKKELLNGP